MNRGYDSGATSRHEDRATRRLTRWSLSWIAAGRGRIDGTAHRGKSEPRESEPRSSRIVRPPVLAGQRQVTPAPRRVAARLLETGVEPAQVANYLYETGVVIDGAFQGGAAPVG